MSKDNNFKLAKQIIEKYGDVKESVDGTHWVADLLATIGMQMGTFKEYLNDDNEIVNVSKEDAIDEMAKQIAGELDNGALTLADDWAAQHDLA